MVLEHFWLVVRVLAQKVAVVDEFVVDAEALHILLIRVLPHLLHLVLQCHIVLPNLNLDLHGLVQPHIIVVGGVL